MVTVRQLTDKAQTADEMYNLVDRFASDLSMFTMPDGTPLDQVPFPAFFTIVAQLPYRQDDPGVEVVSRPFHILDAPWAAWDCKKKAILVAAWLKRNGVPYRFVAVSRKPSGDIHHCIVEALTADEGWQEIDATYPHNHLGQVQRWTKREVLSGEATGTNEAILVSMYGEGEPSPVLSESFNSALRTYAPERMGDMGASEIVTLIVGIVAALASVTVAIISAASARRDRERQEAFTAKQIQTSYDLQTKLMQQGADIDAAKTAEKQKQMQQLLLVGGLAAGAVIFFVL